MTRPLTGPFPKAPAPKLKIHILKNCKSQGQVNQTTYKRLPYLCYPYQTLWVTKNPQTKHSLKPSIQQELYHLKRSLRIGHHSLTTDRYSPSHHIKNTQHFVEQTKSIQLQQEECMSSYDVKALFTSVPVDPALDIICGKLQQDPMLHTRTPFPSTTQSFSFEFCLKSTFTL